MKQLVICLVIISFIFCGPLAAKIKVGESEFVDIKTPGHFPDAAPDTLVWSHTIEKPGMAWIKPHFDKFRLNPADYIELVDINGVVIERILGSDLADQNETRFKVKDKGNGKISFWAPAVDGDVLTVNLYAGSIESKAYGFRIDKLGLGTVPIFEEPAQESICGTDDKVSIACVAYTPYGNRGRAVGRMLFEVDNEWKMCTGFLCSCDSPHFLTNWHCISSQSTVDTLQVRFYYRLSQCGGMGATYYTYSGDDFIIDNSDYDFCLLTLCGSPQYNYGYLSLLNIDPSSGRESIPVPPPSVGEDIYIIQHPGGRMQEISFGTVYGSSVNSGKDFSYYVDTELGSSGSPVFQESSDKVLGLHHYGGCPNSAVKMNHIYEYITGYLGCN